MREHCVVPSDPLKTFAQVHGARVARKFAEDYRPVSSGGARVISGLLLFGPSGTGKSLLRPWWAAVEPARRSSPARPSCVHASTEPSLSKEM